MGKDKEKVDNKENNPWWSLSDEKENVYVSSLTYDEELDGGTDMFAIKLCVITTEAGNLVPMYGLFNKKTGVREAEQRQLSAAITWAEVLTKVALGESMPGLDDDVHTPPALVQ